MIKAEFNAFKQADAEEKQRVEENSRTEELEASVLRIKE